MEKIICIDCNREFKSLDSLRRHRSQVHNISSEQTYIDYKLNGVRPTCECGCGENTSFLSFGKGFVDYVLGHASRVHNNWGHNPKAIKKSHETQKKMYESGELAVWNKGLTIDDPRVKDNIEKMLSNPDRCKNISKALTNKPKSKEHKENLSETAKERWSDPKEREKQRYRRLKYFAEKQFNKKSKLEYKFEGLLNELNVEFKQQYPINGYLFDFYIPNKNLLIEVDGDWYHFNEAVHSLPLSPIQENTIKNDNIKNDLAEKLGYNLIRFWESDINNNIKNVKSILKTVLT